MLKHVFLTRILLYLHGKEKPFRYIDTHAGAGLYDLTSPEAARMSEARDGVGRLLAAPDLGAAAPLLEPWLAAVQAVGAPRFYPGSPLIAQKFLRAGDRAIFCEMLPEASKSLRRALNKDIRTKLVETDGYRGLKAFVPPPERRGLVLIDPPYERRDEYERVFDTFCAALGKWSGGIFVIWLPVKEKDVVDAFCRAIAALAPASLRVDLQVETPASGRPLARAGLVIVNPPWVLEDQAQIILPVLARLMARGPGAEFSIELLGAPA
ncbi:23S rRNA (adenine(2030)-N(6))-methyltransferase RlmJ [uncultured Rhodoblastus sp.]|uniref:23S rRNA (adenine(2030)-N(6))-methyltransferase RlmJ n=1 Tax=uncultured Rhodoblastus sp. TaxID=543037 RepID=UPI0025F36307|nr:23S rRNA (adenine(2030)-N(6))-methyltransferase RlmJ [uncultured Rhodoblastus sp.]